jgi:anti-sigma factor RsiW
VTAAHLDYEALADFAEGILDDDTATSTEEHLAGCDDCRRRAAEVAEVSRVLARAPTPPMPAHLVDRLDAALAAEAAAHPPTRRQNRRFQLVAAAAAAVVLVGGGAAAVRTVMDHGDSDSSTATQPPIADRTHSQTANPMGPQVTRAVPFTVVRTGTAYTAASLDAQIHSALSKAGAKRPALSAAADSLGPCVARVGGGKVPLLVDSATYEGRPATVIALPAADAAHADVWVVGPDCSAPGGGVLAHRQVAR